MADVFLSYAREDRESAKRLADAIQEKGWSVWWDRRIPAGKSFEDVIEREIEAASCVIVLWTRHSVASEWVRNEGAEGARRRILIPIRLEDVRLPLSFRHLQASDLFDWTDAELEDCFCSLEAMIGTPTKPKLPPRPPAGETPRTDPAISASTAPLPIQTDSHVSTINWRPVTWITVSTLVALLISIFIAIGVRKKNELTSSTDPELTTSETTAIDTTITVAASDTMATVASLGEITTMRSEYPASVFVSATDTSATSFITSESVVVSKEVVDLQTGFGTITIELFPEHAPRHVSNFIFTARTGGFDGAPIIYVYSGGISAGYESRDELPQEPNDLAYVRGTILGLLQSGKAPFSDSRTKFWIAFEDRIDLNRQHYTAFGRVINGMNAVDAIAKVPVNNVANPLTPITITRAVVRDRSRPPA